MDLYTTNGENKIDYYELDKFDIQERVIRSYFKPTIIRQEKCIGGEEDRLFFEGSDVYFMTFESEEYLGQRLQSNFGVACNGCDHYYEDVYRYHYIKNFLVQELSSAIQGYYATINLDIPKARASFNKIGECLECSTFDILVMMEILESLVINKTKTFTNLDEFAYFILIKSEYDRVHHLRNYKEDINGLTIKDICLPVEVKLPYVLNRLREELTSSDKVQEYLDFMPEIKDKHQELIGTFERCRKRKGY